MGKGLNADWICRDCGLLICPSEYAKGFRRCRNCRKERANLNKVAMQRRADGKCVECGETLSKHDLMHKYIRCELCRDARKPKENDACVPEADHEAATQRYLQEYRLRSGVCSSCVWANVHENVIFCPAADGTCMRKEFRGEYENKRIMFWANTDCIAKER